MFNLRSDLAIEAGEIFKEQNPDISEIDGVSSKIFEKDNCSITEVYIKNKSGEIALGKPCGTYITIETEVIKNNDAEKFINLSSIHLTVLLEPFLSFLSIKSSHSEI